MFSRIVKDEFHDGWASLSWQAPPWIRLHQSCPDCSCTAREGLAIAPCLIKPNSHRGKKGDDRLLDREDLSRGLRAKEAEQERSCPSSQGPDTGSKHKLFLRTVMYHPIISILLLDLVAVRCWARQLTHSGLSFPGREVGGTERWYVSST